MLNLSSSGSRSGSRGRARRRRPRGAWLSIVAVAGVLALGVPTASAAAVRAGSSQATAASTYYSTSLKYVLHFRARISSWFLQRIAETAGSANTPVMALTGSSGVIGPPVRIAPGPNIDTVYAAFIDLDLSQGPQILTIPPTSSRFSVASYDVWGNVLNTVPAQPGTYALALRTWHGTLPPGVTRVNIPYPVTQFYVRADRYSSTGVNMVASSKAFVKGIHLASLPTYEANPSSGTTIVVPQTALFVSTKQAYDRLAPYTRTLYQLTH